MARYFCHITKDGVLYEDTLGFDAADDVGAAKVVRAIAAVLLASDRSSGDSIVTVKSKDGAVVLTSTLGDLTAKRQ